MRTDRFHRAGSTAVSLLLLIAAAGCGSKAGKTTAPQPPPPVGPASLRPWYQTKSPTGGAVSALMTDGQSLFAATSNGLLRSVDGGTNWTYSTRERVVSLTRNGTTLYAAGPDGILRSQDGGGHWQRLPDNTLPAGAEPIFAHYTHDRLMVGLSTGGAYSTINDGDVWLRSGLDAGGAVTQIATGPSNALYAIAGNTAYRGSRPNAWTAIPGLTPGEALSIVERDGNVVVGTDGNGVRWSDNGGATWSSGLGLPLGVKVYALAALSSGLYAGTSAGLYVSNSGGEVWNLVTPAVLAGTSFLAVAAHSSLLFAATTDLGVLRSHDRVTWMSGGGPALQVDALLDLGSVMLAGTTRGVRISSDGGLLWRSTDFDDDLVVGLVAQQSAVFAATNRSGIWRSVDGGSHWMSASAGLPYLRIGALASNGTTLVCWPQTGGLYRSVDDGNTWIPAATTLPSGASVNGLAASGTRFLASTSSLSASAVYASDDGGVTWTPSAIGLPPVYPRTIIAQGSTVFLATFSGVYRSTDAGASWSAAGLEGLNVASLAYQAGILAATTNDFALYRSPDGGVTWQRDFGVPQARKVFAGQHGLFFDGTNTLWRVDDRVRDPL